MGGASNLPRRKTPVRWPWAGFAPGGKRCTLQPDKSILLFGKPDSRSELRRLYRAVSTASLLSAEHPSYNSISCFVGPMDSVGDSCADCIPLLEFAADFSRQNGDAFVDGCSAVDSGVYTLPWQKSGRFRLLERIVLR